MDRGHSDEGIVLASVGQGSVGMSVEQFIDDEGYLDGSLTIIVSNKIADDSLIDHLWL